MPSLLLSSLLRDAIDVSDRLLRNADLEVCSENDLCNRFLSELTTKCRKGTTENDDSGDNGFKLEIDCLYYKENELSIKLMDGELIIHGEHDEKEDKDGFIKRQFTRRVKISDDIEYEKMSATLSARGVLVVKAPRKQFTNEKKERVIPIEVISKPEVKEESAASSSNSGTDEQTVKEIAVD